jgi:hypothetical protein
MDYAARLILNICLWLLIPILTIFNVLLLPVLGLVIAAGLVCYAWFMWGVVILFFSTADPAPFRWGCI